jgi:hypothetical protein
MCTGRTRPTLESAQRSEMAMLSRRYEVFVRGVVPAELLEEMADSHREIEALTVLRGQVRDQAELQGLLRRLHNFGLELIELRQVPVEPILDSHPTPRAGDL